MGCRLKEYIRDRYQLRRGKPKFHLYDREFSLPIQLRLSRQVVIRAPETDCELRDKSVCSGGTRDSGTDHFKY